MEIIIFCLLKLGIKVQEKKVPANLDSECLCVGITVSHSIRQCGVPVLTKFAGIEGHFGFVFFHLRDYRAKYD